MTGFDEVDVPATADEINRWWGKYAIQLIGFTAASSEGPEGVVHWVAVARNLAGRTDLFRLCATMNDELPWARVPGEPVTCMTCLVRASREQWKEPG